MSKAESVLPCEALKCISSSGLWYAKMLRSISLRLSCSSSFILYGEFSNPELEILWESFLFIASPESALSPIRKLTGKLPLVLSLDVDPRSLWLTILIAPPDLRVYSCSECIELVESIFKNFLPDLVICLKFWL
jgi:hypothetical protein